MNTIIKYAPYELQLRYPFKIATYSRTFTPIMLVTIRYHEFTGYGEASMPQYLGETTSTSSAFLKKVNDSGILNQLDISPDAHNINALLAEIDKLDIQHTPSKAALDIALYDLVGKIQQKPVWKILGSNPDKMPLTSFTIGMDTPEIIRKKVLEADKFALLKIKLGSDNDKDIINTIRSITDKPLYIDANQGWKDKFFASDMVAWLQERGAVMIEQPLPKTDLDGNAYVTEHSALPIIADESCQRLTDEINITGAFDGINIKLMKCTGLREAQKMLKLARKNNLKVMMGCMSETSCGILAAASLAPQCDFVDLDSTFMVTNNPFKDPVLENGRLVLSNDFGLGLVKNYEL